MWRRQIPRITSLQMSSFGRSRQWVPGDFRGERYRVSSPTQHAGDNRLRWTLLYGHEGNTQPGSKNHAAQLLRGYETTGQEIM
ncbi:hypothetical protein OSTOST_04882 [Ostertagia ostertagi]